MKNILKKLAANTLLAATLITVFTNHAVSDPKTEDKPNQPVVIIETNVGSIELALFPNKAPKTVANFLRYVDEGFYNGTIFHRTIQNFMIQGGGFDQTLSKKDVHKPIINEGANGLRNKRGTIAMARTSNINSATSQFFINTKNNLALDTTGSRFGYAVFGKVINGMDVVNSISTTETKRVGPHQNVPLKAVIIKKIVQK